MLKRPEGRAPRAFSLIEILVTVALLSLIVVALMGVFSSTQTAFRASLTQTDVLESSRGVIGLITRDLERLAPSYGISNASGGAMNFYAAVTNGASPLVQPLVGSIGGGRTNIIENIFVLNHQNTRWWGVGYAVDMNDSQGVYSLYRLEYPSDASVQVRPETIFTNVIFQRFFNSPTNGGSHLMDGVVHLRVRAFDTGGALIVTNRVNVRTNFAGIAGEVNYQFYSNALPASVELEMGILEDRTLQRAESLRDSYQAQTNYLAKQAGKVHLFRQRVLIRNADPAAYR